MVFKFQFLKNFSDQPFLIFQQSCFDKVLTIFLGCWVKAATLSCRFSFQQHLIHCFLLQTIFLNFLSATVEYMRFFEPQIDLAEW